MMHPDGDGEGERSNAELDGDEGSADPEETKEDLYDPDRYVNRELSWLGFNERVLQEAADRTVPLFERITFLAIYSSNLDEFFRVRVASLRSLLRLSRKSRNKLAEDPAAVLERVNTTVLRQQEEFGRIFRDEIMPGLRYNNIHILSEQDLTETQREWVASWFDRNLLEKIHAFFIRDGYGSPFLDNHTPYLAVALKPRMPRKGWGRVESEDETLAMVEVPSKDIPRFLTLPPREGKTEVIFLDDVIRLMLPRVFPGYDPIGAWSVKLSRDAELYIDDEFSTAVLRKIRKGLRKRETGVPSRFLYDASMPESVLRHVMHSLELGDEDLVAGARYHNFKDFFDFPFPDRPDLRYPPCPPLPHPLLDGAGSVMKVVGEQDVMLHYPYHSFESPLRFLREAVADPDVESIAVTLYRVAPDSAVARALADAAAAGKAVTALVELRARFDEEANIFWGARMERAGVRVLYSFPGLKIHAKICLITRREGEGLRRYGYLSTGNFNEKTARVYCDHSLLTADPRITNDLEQVFSFLAGENQSPSFEHLLVAPFTLRSRLYAMIDREIAFAREGKPASIFVKINNLEDREMIEKLYEADAAGVSVRMIVRGMCCMRIGVEGLSRDVEAISIVDRFLEHARLYIFHNGGDEQWFVSSADWMNRNLSRRVEVAFPIYDEGIRAELQEILRLQWADNQKARLLDEAGCNRYRPRHDDEIPIRAQMDTYRMLEGERE